MPRSSNTSDMVDLPGSALVRRQRPPSTSPPNVRRVADGGDCHEWALSLASQEGYGNESRTTRRSVHAPKPPPCSNVAILLPDHHARPAWKRPPAGWYSWIRE